MAVAAPNRPATNGSGPGAGRTSDASTGPANSTSRSPSAQSQRIGSGATQNLSSSYNSQQNGNSLGARLSAQMQQARRVESSSSMQSGPKTPPEDEAAGGHRATKRVKKLRSQYPRDNPERHVEYILVASFDIDRGSIMEHQYPAAISGDESMLAELMLPDQAHMRNEDWTIFFLHKDTTEEDEAREEARAERRRAREEREAARQQAIAEGREDELPAEEDDEEDDDDDDEGGEGPPLIYVLNLVNTKHDTSVRRGAVVKAMAICTRHPFLHIYKPLLLLALEEYFKNPTIDTLERLYGAVNNMDLSLMPRLTLLERNILQASDIKDLFIEKFDQMIQQRMLEDESIGSPSMDSPGRSRMNYQLPRDTHEYETRVTYHGIPIPIKVPTAVSPEFVGDFSLLKLIQNFSAPHAASPQPFALHPHLTTLGAYTHPILVLINAVLTQKRIIFLGHNRPSGEVAEAVLAACALASGGVLQGFTRHAFPYTDLTKIDDLLNVPGFIAGVTNPTFGMHPEWWDLLCDIPTGRMKISPKVEPAPMTEGLTFFQQQHPTYAPSALGVLPPATQGSGTGGNSGVQASSDPTGDGAFMEEVQRAINARHGEPALRSKFRDYIFKFTRLAAAFEETVFGASALYIGASEADAGAHGVSGHGYVWADDVARARELAANAWRIEGWRMSRSYYALIQDLAALFGRRPIRAIDVLHQVDRLRVLRLPRDESAKIFCALRDAVTGYDGVCQLLAATPENQAGLFHISLGLWHPDRSAREATVMLLERVKEHEAGRHYYYALGRFARAAAWRVRKDMDARDRDDGLIDSVLEDRRERVRS